MKKGTRRTYLLVNILLRSIVAALLFICVSPAEVKAEESETVYYSRITGEIPDGTVNAAFTVGSHTFGISMSGLKMGTAEVQEDTLKVTYDNYLRLQPVSGGFQIYSEGRSKRYLAVDEATGKVTVGSGSSGHWEYSNSHLFYVTETGTRYAITGADESGLTAAMVPSVSGLMLNRGAARQEEEAAIAESEEQQDVRTSESEQKTEETDLPDPDEQKETLPEELTDQKEEPQPLQGTALQEASDRTEQINETDFADPKIPEQTEPSMKGGIHAQAPVFLRASGLRAASEEAPADVSVYTGTGVPSRPGPGPGGRTDKKKPVFVTMPSAYHYVLEGSGYEAPVYQAEVRCGDEGAADQITLRWYVEGTLYRTETVTVPAGGTVWSGEVRIPELQERVSGVYPVKCEASVTLSDSTTHTADVSTNFIVAKGVQPDSMLTFSDVHESFEQIGEAINDIIITTGGYLPSLIVATGDYSTNQYAGTDPGNIETVLKQLIQRVKLQVAGIDTVWVSGNHDNGYAAAQANTEGPMLGLDVSEYQDAAHGITGTGILFDTRSADFAANAGTSQVTSGLIVIGVNYEDLDSLGKKAPDGTSTVYDYGTAADENSVYQFIKNALERVKENYSGELVVISAHAGLHALGIDPDSTGLREGEWAGRASYNIKNSDAVTQLINEYAKQYGMDIVFLFGHDHSRGEQEFIKAPNDTIAAAADYYSRITKELTLEFTYAHAGYITGSIGGDKRYTYLTWNETEIRRDMKKAGQGNAVLDGLSRTISRRYRRKDEAKEETKKEETRYSVNPYSGVVTCQMAGLPEHYAWNEAAKACQPGYIDDFGVFHPLNESYARYYVPNTADTLH